MTTRSTKPATETDAALWERMNRTLVVGGWHMPKQCQDVRVERIGDTPNLLMLVDGRVYQVTLVRSSRSAVDLPRDALRALVRLGVLTHADVVRMTKLRRRVEDIREFEHNYSMAVKYCRRLGVKPPVRKGPR